MIKIEALFIAVYLFFAGFIYGDEPVKLEFSYDIPSEVYVYEPGDSVEINVTVKNVGRPFEERIYYGATDYTVIYLNTDEEKIVRDPRTVGRPDAYAYRIFKHGKTETNEIFFTIPEDAQTGVYNMKAIYRGYCGSHSQIFENVFEVK